MSTWHSLGPRCDNYDSDSEEEHEKIKQQEYHHNNVPGIFLR
jgi:hypothetical protein